MTKRTSYSVVIFAFLALTAHANTPPAVSEKTLDPNQYPLLPAINPTSDTEPSEPKPQDTAVEVSPEQLLNDPPLLRQALYSSVLNNHINAIRLLLPLYEQLPQEYQTGDGHILMLTLAKASLAKEDKDLDKAIILYKKALKIDQNIPAARFALAQCYFDLKRYSNAKNEFTLLAQNNALPEPIKFAIAQYLYGLDQKESWHFSFNAHYTKDKNINNSPDYDTVNLGYGTWTLPKAESARGISYQVSAEKSEHLGNSFHLKKELNLYGKDYWDNHKYDDLTARASIGIAYQTPTSELSLIPYGERRIYDNHGYSKEFGLSTSFSEQFTNHRLQASFDYGKDSYDDRKYLDGHRKQASVSWFWRQAHNQYWTITGDYSQKTAKDTSDSYTRRGARVSWVRAWGAGHTQTSLSLGFAKKQHDGKDFLGIRRLDKEYSVNVGLWDNRIQLFGIMPRLIGNYQKVNSNHPFYPYDKHSVFVQFARSF